ncbi:MAG: hypothetical protein FWD13_12160 [Treponema sp.]|nr:hypothetical protein [Treponema sp.]
MEIESTGIGLIITSAIIIYIFILIKENAKSKYKIKIKNNVNVNNNEKIILFECVICNNKYSINVYDIYNTFICRNCNSIFSYEWKNNKIIINVIKKEEYIPEYINNILILIIQ